MAGTTRATGGGGAKDGDAGTTGGPRGARLGSFAGYRSKTGEASRPTNPMGRAVLRDRFRDRDGPVRARVREGAMSGRIEVPAKDKLPGGGRGGKGVLRGASEVCSE